MKKILISIGSVIASGLPVLVLAQATFKTGYVDSLISGGTKIVQGLFLFLLGLSVVWFIWNVIKYTMSEEDDGKDKAKSQMVWGIVAIAVCVSVWGIVGILQSAFGVQNGQVPSGISSGSMIPGGSSQQSTPPAYTPVDFGSGPSASPLKLQQ